MVFERRGLAGAGIAIAAMLAYVGARAFEPPRYVALAVALGAAIVVAILSRSLPARLDGALAGRPLLAALFLLVTIAAVIQTARLSAFMLTSRYQYSVFWFDPFYVRHWCATAYQQAAQFSLMRHVNVYDPGLYSGHELVGFSVDEYEYPPPFLVLARLWSQLSASVFTLRALWYSIEAALVAATLVAIAAWIQRPRLYLFLPLIWIALPTQMTLQMGNFHLATIAISLLAMVAFERGHDAGGGALLAVAMWSKLFPGLLLIHLLAQRRWRAVVWSCAWSIAILVGALIILGPDPFAAFVFEHLPRVASGKAFPGIEGGRRLAINISVFSLIFRLKAAGIPGMSNAVARLVSLMYGVGLVVLAVRLAARTGVSRAGRVQIWIALLFLASIQNAFAPITYVGFPVIFSLALLWRETRRLTSRIAYGVAWLMVSLVGLVGVLASLPEWVRLGSSTLVLFTLVAIVLVSLRRRALTLDEESIPLSGGLPR